MFQVNTKCVHSVPRRGTLIVNMEMMRSFLVQTVVTEAAVPPGLWVCCVLQKQKMVFDYS